MTNSTNRRAMVHVNGLFLTQRITGQQRYAREATRRLATEASVRVLEAPSRVRSSAVLTHLWAQTGLPVRSAHGVLLSMTARSPVLARRHLLVVHDLFPLTHPEWYSRRYATTHGAQLAAQLRAATALAAVSQPVVEQLEQRFPGKRVILAPNAPADCFARGPSVDGLDDRPEETFLLAVGSMDPRKNFARLVRAHAALPEDLRIQYPLWIVGGEGVNFSSIGVDLTESSTGVRTLGYVDDDALADLYRRSTAVVVPSLDEGFGLPVVEALAAGAALVASDIPVFRWVAGSRARYFDPLSEESITAALAEVVACPPSLADREAGRDEVRRRFTWEQTAATLLAGAGSLL
jgi:glycosyltransferase involved in cell wall biosynthesis